MNDDQRIRSPVDRFIQKCSEHRNLSLAADADRVTLIRRVTFDLTGLPPQPDEVLAFARDPDPEAYEKLIDRLLASPSYGDAGVKSGSMRRATLILMATSTPTRIARSRIVIATTLSEHSTPITRLTRSYVSNWPETNLPQIASAMRPPRATIDLLIATDFFRAMDRMVRARATATPMRSVPTNTRSLMERSRLSARRC